MTGDCDQHCFAEGRRPASVELKRDLQVLNLRIDHLDFRDPELQLLNHAAVADTTWILAVCRLSAATKGLGEGLAGFQRHQSSFHHPSPAACKPATLWSFPPILLRADLTTRSHPEEAEEGNNDQRPASAGVCRGFPLTLSQDSSDMTETATGNSMEMF